jgi:hypothetical protein
MSHIPPRVRHIQAGLGDSGGKCYLSEFFVLVLECSFLTCGITKSCSNSIPASFNLSYDHGEYRQRIEKDKEVLETMDLNAMYKDPTLTDFLARI